MHELEHRFGVRFTTAEFLRMGECGAFDDMKVELVAGRLERSDLPMHRHAALHAKIMIRLGQINVGARLLGAIGIDLGDDTVLECDVAVLRYAVAEDRWLRPDDVQLVVEIADTNRSRDVGLKRVLYSTADIPHYWVVDGDRSVVHVYGDPSDGDYSRVSTVGFGEPLDVPGTDATIVID